MKTAADREAEFRADLKVLLDKHNAQLEDRDFYGMPTVCPITMLPAHDESGIQTAEFCEFNL